MPARCPSSKAARSVRRAYSASPRAQREGFRVLSGEDASVLLEVSDAAIRVEQELAEFWDPDFGSGVARLEDLDGHGVRDFLIGAESYRLGGGAVCIYSGATRALLERITRREIRE